MVTAANNAFSRRRVEILVKCGCWWCVGFDVWACCWCQLVCQWVVSSLSWHLHEVHNGYNYMKLICHNTPCLWIQSNLSFLISPGHILCSLTHQFSLKKPGDKVFEEIRLFCLFRTSKLVGYQDLLFQQKFWTKNGSNVTIQYSPNLWQCYTLTYIISELYPLGYAMSLLKKTFGGSMSISGWLRLHMSSTNSVVYTFIVPKSN